MWVRATKGNLIGLLLAAAVLFPDPVAASNDYPTEARVDYVLACMAANGNSRLVMQKCACSIDYIAGEIPYETYVQAETVKRMRAVPGERTGIFRSSEFAQTTMEQFQRIQVQADLACF